MAAGEPRPGVSGRGRGGVQRGACSLDQAAREVAEAVGVVLDGTPRIGHVTRCATTDARPGKRNGWITVSARGAVVAGNWRTGEKAYRAVALDGADVLAAEDAEESRAKRQIATARLAAILWQRSRPDPTLAPYLTLKAISPCGARFLPRDERRAPLQGYRLILPVRDLDGTIASAQVIDALGVKRFLSGGKTKGRGYLIGELPDRASHAEVILCEGFATGAALHLDTGAPVACAFSAGNLLHLGRALRRRLPRAAITVAADNDAHTQGNPGIAMGRKAARAIGARCVWPREPGDFNDEWRRRHP